MLRFKTYLMTKSPNFEQITRMMTQAMAKLAGAKPILHSDQSWQYQTSGFRAICQQNSITQICREREMAQTMVQRRVFLMS